MEDVCVGGGGILSLCTFIEMSQSFKFKWYHGQVSIQLKMLKYYVLDASGRFSGDPSLITFALDSIPVSFKFPESICLLEAT